MSPHRQEVSSTHREGKANSLFKTQEKIVKTTPPPNNDIVAYADRPRCQRCYSKITPGKPPHTTASTYCRPCFEVMALSSLRVTIDDPCRVVLPLALKRYGINDDWRRYALFIIWGDEERRTGLDEKPFRLFKKFDKEGKKPMFALRRLDVPPEIPSAPIAAVVEDNEGSISVRQPHSLGLMIPF